MDNQVTNTNASMSTKRITDFRVTWEASHAQYYQGHSTMFTEYTHSGQGCGETLREAFEDSMEQLCEQDVFLSGKTEDGSEQRELLEFQAVALAQLVAQLKDPAMLEWDIVRAECPVGGQHTKECAHTINEPVQECIVLECDGAQNDEDHDCAVCAGEWHFYVNVDVVVEEQTI